MLYFSTIVWPYPFAPVHLFSSAGKGRGVAVQPWRDCPVGSGEWQMWKGWHVGHTPWQVNRDFDGADIASLEFGGSNEQPLQFAAGLSSGQVYIHIHIYIYIYICIYVCIYIYIYIYLHVYRPIPPYRSLCRVSHLYIYSWYRVATTSKLLKIIGLFCKRAL